MQEIEPVAVAKKFYGFREAVAAEPNGIAVGRVDLDPVQCVLKPPIAAIALARELDIMDFVIEFETKRNGERRRERSPALPFRRKGIGHIKQQRREFGFPVGLL